MATKKRAKKSASKTKKRAKKAATVRRSVSPANQRKTRGMTRGQSSAKPRKAHRAKASKAKSKAKKKKSTVAQRASPKPAKRKAAKPKPVKVDKRKKAPPKASKRKAQSKPASKKKAAKAKKHQAVKRTRRVEQVQRAKAKGSKRYIVTSKEKLTVEAMQFYRDLVNGGEIKRTRKGRVTKFQHTGRGGLETTIKVGMLLDEENMEQILSYVDEGIAEVAGFHELMFCSMLLYQTSIRGASPNAEVFQEPKSGLAMYGAWTGVSSGSANRVRVMIRRRLEAIIDSDPNTATVVHIVVIRGFEPGDFDKEEA